MQRDIRCTYTIPITERAVKIQKVKLSNTESKKNGCPILRTDGQIKIDVRYFAYVRDSVSCCDLVITPVPM